MGGVIVANLYGIREADWIIMILPLRTSHCVNYTLIDRRKNCPLHGCNFCPRKFDVSCSIFSQLHYIFIKTFPIHIFFNIMWMIKIMPQRVKLIKSRFKGGEIYLKNFLNGDIVDTLSMGERWLFICVQWGLFTLRDPLVPLCRLTLWWGSQLSETLK